MDGPTPTPTDSPPRVQRSLHRRQLRSQRRSSTKRRVIASSRSDQNIDVSASAAPVRTRRHRSGRDTSATVVRPKSIPIDYNLRHRSILANSEYNLESGGDANTVSDYHSEPFCRRSRSSQSSASAEPFQPLFPLPHRRHNQFSSEDSSTSSHRKARPRTLDLHRVSVSTEEDIPVPYSPGAGGLQVPNPLPTLDASPAKSAPGIRKMYIETKINMLEIIQAGLQLKLDMQCVREQFLSLLETYTYVEDKFLLRPASMPPASLPSTATQDKPLSAGRARVRALYEARRARIQARRAKFAKELGSTPVSSRRNPRQEEVEARLVREEEVVLSPRIRSRSRRAAVFTATSSEAMSDSTMDEWDLKSVSSCDPQDCSKHRHNNSPSSEGIALTSSTSPDSDIPLGGAANMSSGAGNSSSTSSSDGTGFITKMTKSVTVHDKENQKPLCEDARNNNLVNQNGGSAQTDTLSRGSGGSGASTSKLAPIREEYHSDSNGNSPLNRTLTSMQGDLKSFYGQDMETDDNDYVQMTGIDPSIMDYNGGDMSHFGGGGEAMQSRISGLNLTQELPRTCQNSYNFPNPSFADTSIPIYTAKSKRDVEGEYVMLASPFHHQDVGDYVTLKAPEENSMMSFFESNMEPSMLMPHNMTKAPWSVTSLNMTENFGPSNIITTNSSAQLLANQGTKKDSPVKYATSESIRQLYTKSSPKASQSQLTSNRSLRDISNISRISTRSELHEHITDSTIGSMLDFGSPEIYPLNSTMKPQPQTASEDTDDTLENIADDTLDSVPGLPPRRPFDTRTSFSEPSAVLRAPDATQLSLASPTSKDDSYIINSFQPEPQPEMTEIPEYQPDDFITPKRNMPMKPQLCKEHGVHPTFGGPCIFEDSFDVLDSSTSSEDEAEMRNSRKSSRSLHYNATDTDCDSSYLSECVDDTHFTSDFGGDRLDKYTYDARNARMMRRQTGQADIKRVKDPIGLSESDLHFNVTRKHLSLEATRSSLPDLANLSVPPSECSEDQDSTLKLTDINESEDKSHNHLDKLVTSKQMVQQPQGRPLSIATVTTTTDDSPESNPGGFPVPVNSPNVTDSSSSRPTTDNYDYVDIPIPRDMIPKDTFKMPPPRQIPPRRKPGVGRSGPPSGGGPPSMRPKHLGTYGGSMGSLQPSTSQLSYPTHSLPRRSAHRSEGGSVGDPYSSSGGGGDGHRSRSRHRQPHDSEHDVRSYVQGRHFEISDTSGVKRTVVQHSAVARNLSKDRKRNLAKKLKQFSNNFYNSTGNLQIKTLGHF